MRKRISASVLSVLLTLLCFSACSDKDAMPSDASEPVDISENISSQVITETTSEISEAPASLDTVSEEKSLFSDDLGEYYIVRDSNGEYKRLTEKEYSAFSTARMLDMIFEYSDLEFDEGLSYEDYRNEMMKMYGITEKDIEISHDYECVIQMYGNSENDGEQLSKYAAAAFEYVMAKAEGNASAKEIVIRFYVENECISIYAYYLTDNDYVPISENEFITADGKSVSTFNGTPVKADTKSLFISAYDETRAEFITYDIETDFDVKIYDYEETLDAKMLAESFPLLEELYISAFVTVENPSGFSEMKNLKELHIDVSGYDDLSKLAGLTTDKLYITGLGCSADALADTDVNELTIECTPNAEVMNSIYRLDNITELTVERIGEEEYSLTGIEKLQSLKKLSISTYGNVELKPISMLENVSELYIMASSADDLDSISKMKSVKKLTLHSMDKEDLSFLSEMTWLEKLSLMYVNSSFGTSLQYLDNVSFLSIAGITDGADMSRVYQMKNLEDLMIMGERFNDRGIDSLKKLKSLRLTLCRYNELSNLKKCPELEYLLIYNCDTPEFNAKDIEGMTQLKTLHFNCSEIQNYKSLGTLTGLEDLMLGFCNLSSEEIDRIKEDIPDCVITDEDGNVL